MGTSTEVDVGDFLHPALFYRTPQEYLDGVVPFIDNALNNEQPVLVAVPGPNLALLRDALGAAADEMTMIDMTIAGRNPGRIIGGVLTAFAAEHPDKAVQMIGEPIWAERSAVEYPACVQHEALINNTFAGRDLAVLCPYNAAQLPPEWLADARATHPVLWEGSSEAHSDDFAPVSVWSHYNQPLTRSESAVTHRVRTMDGLTEVRSFTNMYGQWFDLPSSVIEDLRLVATELAAGSLRSAGACTLAIWRDGSHLVCEVRDAGRLDDPLSGRRPYFDETIRGQGLFVVNAVVDLVRAHVSPRGTTIQAILRLDAIA